MQGRRFRGAIGKDYDILKSSIPHYDELQSVIRLEVGKHYRGSKQKSISILEIGCGTGRTTSEILSSNKKINVVTVDNEPLMLSQAKRNLSFQKHRIKFICQDALTSLKKQKSNSFDAFASVFTLHNFERNYRLEVLQHIYRVLKTGGFFINSDKYAHDIKREERPHETWQINQFKKYEKIGRKDLTIAWTKHYLEDAKPDVIMKEKESMKQMKSIGFLDVRKIYRKHLEAVIVARK